MTSNITISKGSYSVTIETTVVTDNWDKKITFIRPATTVQKQDAGPTTVKVIDMLIITHTIVVRGHITPTDSKTAKEVKDDLISIIKGGDVTGTACTVVYAGDSYNMFIEKSMIIEKAFDEPGTLETDIAKYDVQITLSEGVSI